MAISSKPTYGSFQLPGCPLFGRNPERPMIAANEVTFFWSSV
jgi:hypothetical protein